MWPLGFCNLYGTILTSVERGVSRLDQPVNVHLIIMMMMLIFNEVIQLMQGREWRNCFYHVTEHFGPDGVLPDLTGTECHACINRFAAEHGHCLW